MKSKLSYVSFFLVAVIVASFIFNQPHKYPVTEQIIERKGYSLCYNYARRQPIWVYERLTVENLEGNASRNGIKFKVDTLIPALFRVANSDYKGSGFDRGHLCPAGDLCSNQNDKSESFYLSNISPQTPEFNRVYWLKLEKHVRELTRRFKVLQVYSGCAYLPIEGEGGGSYVEYKVIGKNTVSVPTHYFKVILSKGGELIEAYILPNKDINFDKPLGDFRTTIEKVERVAGVLFSR